MRKQKAARAARMEGRVVLLKNVRKMILDMADRAVDKSEGKKLHSKRVYVDRVFRSKRVYNFGVLHSKRVWFLGHGARMILAAKHSDVANKQAVIKKLKVCPTLV